MQCAIARALRPPQKSFFQGGWKRRILTLKCKPQGNVDAWHFYRCSCAMIFRLGERRQSETSAITMRPGWLAQAAFVFWCLPSPSCRVPHPYAYFAEGWIPRSRPSWDLVDTHPRFRCRSDLGAALDFGLSGGLNLLESSPGGASELSPALQLGKMEELIQVLEGRSSPQHTPSALL